MRTLSFDDIQLTPVGDGSRLSCRVRLGGKVWELWFRSRGSQLSRRADPFVPIATVMGVLAGADIEIEGEASPLLLRGADEFQEIFTTWYPPLGRVAVRASSESADASTPDDRARGVGAFFSGGLDSFYTALVRGADLTHLVFVLGVDIRVTNHELAEKVLPHVREAAAALGKPLIEVETNVRDLLDPVAQWNHHAYGQALAAVALALRPALKTVFISSDLTYNVMPPNGSHPLTDPLWSTEAMETVHYGADRSKGQKYAAVGRHPVVLDHLRVCWQNPGNVYNCGRCRKCLGAVSALAALGVLDRSKTLPSRLTTADYWRLATIDTPDVIVRNIRASTAALADDTGAPWPLRAALHLGASARRESVQRAAAAAARFPRRAARSLRRRLRVRV